MMKHMLVAIWALGLTTLGAAPMKLLEGDSVPAVQLVDQDNRSTSLAEPERWTLMTFIFIRCAVMDFCPRMSSNFKAVQTGLNDTGLGNRVRLLSISLDPVHDTPELLREYGIAVGADFGIWQLVTGDEAVIADLTRSFRVVVQKRGVTLDHTLCTVLISPEGKISRIWRGNAWTPAEVLQHAEAVIR